VKSFFAILFNAILIGFVSPALAEHENPYFARIWQAEDGLPENRVVGVVQSSDGFLWVATQTGLVRFDGVRFQRADLAGSPGKIAGTMRILMLDRMGRIWLAKEEGDTLFCFDGAQVRILTADQGLPKTETQSSMAVDGKGGLWITYSMGKVIRYNQDGKVDAFTDKDGLPSSGICWLAADRDGTLWFAKGSHVGVFRNGRFNVLENFDSSEVRIAAARSGGIWICAGQQILKFEEGVETVELGKIIPDMASSRSSYDPSVLLEDREGAVWVGTASAGLYRCDSKAIVQVKVSNPAILSLAEDREANLWVGTRGGGLNQVHRRMISMIKSSSGLPFEGVQSVCQDATGARWAVGDNGVLARSQGTNWTIQSLSNGSVQPYVTCAAADTNGSVWIGTRAGGLYHWADGQFKDLSLQASLREKSLRSLLVMSNGDLWIGANSPDVLYRLRGEKLQSFDLPPGHRFIRAMAEDATGNFWAGASDGLLVRVTGDALVDETAKSSSLSIRCLHGAANGDLWIGYAGAGAGRLRNGQITRFSTEQGLPNDYIAQILTDNRDSVWFAGNQGIFQVRERDFDDLAEGLAARVWPAVYGRSEGLPGLQASFDYCPASVRAGDRLFFSMLSGLAEVRLDYSRLNYRPPNVFIERVTDDKQIFAVYQAFTTASSTNTAAPMELSHRGDKGELRLPPGLPQVQFEFTALSFVTSDNVRFRYQLEGLDKDWVDAGMHRIASYTHPPPGHYRFKVIACNNDGIWNNTGDTLPVTFEPYVWETLWFKLAVTLISFAALCGVVVLVLRRRHRLVVERLEHQHALELERTRIARDLHDDLGVGLTEIGLLGDLAGANTLVPETSREKLQEITDRARTLAASLDEIVWAINPTNDTSQSLMEYFFEYAQKLLSRAGIRCRLEVIEPMTTGNLNAEERHEVFHAFKEALNNVIRHSGATEVQVSLAVVSGELLIRVADNGCGFVVPCGEGSLDGLVGMRERLYRLGGRCEINGTSGSGTTVTFIIPMQPNTKP
jgi:signal transduction histidine kinase/ligand-binding sensor domain-containing protein